MYNDSNHFTGWHWDWISGPRVTPEWCLVCEVRAKGLLPHPSGKAFSTRWARWSRQPQLPGDRLELFKAQPRGHKERSKKICTVWKQLECDGVTMFNVFYFCSFKNLDMIVFHSVKNKGLLKLIHKFTALSSSFFWHLQPSIYDPRPSVWSRCLRCFLSVGLLLANAWFCFVCVFAWKHLYSNISTEE